MAAPSGNDRAEARLWRLHADDAELCLLAGANQAPAIVHLGPPLGPVSTPQALAGARADSLIRGPAGIPLLPDPAAGWTGEPGWSGGDAAQPWQAEVAAPDAETLSISYWHTDGRRVEYTVSVLDAGVFAFDMSVHSSVPEPLAEVAYSIGLPPQALEGLGFTGRWAGEFATERRNLAGGWQISSRCGSRTAHDAFPGWLAGETSFGEDHGELLAMHLAWFGNYRFMVQRTREGRYIARYVLDLAELSVDPGGARHMPTLYLSWSDKGLNGIRQRFQDAARRMRVRSGRTAAQQVQLNTWEGVYFDHQLDRLKAMADAAAALGVERFVLDDGWFGRRVDDSRGLGDWTPRPDVYPQGLHPLIDHVNAAGMQFGLWVEPEMANADSALYEAHPEWILGRPDQPLGRHQYALDLCNPDCFQHLRCVLTDIVDDASIDSLKWDMNRDVPQAAGRPLVPAVLRLVDTVQGARPDLDIEACASGGGRADWSALGRCNRVWLSDAHDPDVRLPMMAAFGLFAPPEVMGCHIGPEVSHQTGRRWSLHARAAMSVLGSMGLELDPLELSAAQQADVRAYIDLHKRHRSWLAQGHLLALPHPDPGLCAVGVFARERNRALICVLQMRPRADNVPAPLKIRHLRGDVRVRAPLLDRSILRGARQQPQWVAGEALQTHGEFLGAHGLPMPVMAPMRALLVEVVPLAGDTETDQPVPGI
ncbi:MAG: alpha-galactosidase [Gammaproteobacteria bacterium]|nr:alpha-galactosidase [Gammaproteobacteria bacterium]